DGPDRGLDRELQKDRICVGTAEANDLVIRDPAASRHHFEISVDAAGCHLRDLGSTNGTFVNGLRVVEAYLVGGAVVEIGRTRLRFDILAEQTELELSSQGVFGNLLGSSAAMRRVFATLGKVAPRDTTVLITGESGTGKELAARALHEQSSRKGG